MTLICDLCTPIGEFILTLITQYLQQEILADLELDHAYHEVCLGLENSDLFLSDEVRVDGDTGGGGGSRGS